jgi:DNA repair exonuclease SbcCD ATPase subunit
MSQHATPVHEETELDLEIEQLAQAVAALKHRHADVQLAEREQVVLQRQRNELKSKGRNCSEVRQELKAIQERLAELDLLLESRLVNLWEPFWQAVRFGGLGITIGWFFCAWNR